MNLTGLDQFQINDGSRFPNRKLVWWKDSLLFDGYSVWMRTGEKPLREGSFSLCFSLFPLGFSGGEDGIFSWLDRKEKKGFSVGLLKGGRVRIRFGNGKTLFGFDSINAHVRIREWNRIIVIFRQDAGWCDLYVNGVLSNRKQFLRHMRPAFPEGMAFLGKYVDGDENSEISKTGAFYGYLQEACLEERKLPAEEIRRLQKTLPKETPDIPCPDRSAYEKDMQRPRYHLIAPGKWMNEPHGPFSCGGYYHIFYQANPHAPIWNHLQWGHLISRDMVHWEDLPLALETDEDGIDPDGCWSGSALVDANGQPRIFYTAGNDREFPNQSVAMAVADPKTDPKLVSWEKRGCKVRQQEGWLGEFRDPFVWMENGEYFMLVGTGDENNGGGNAALYVSDDCENWNFCKFFLEYDYEKNRSLGHVWELPVLLPLREESGKIACHILLLCACQIEGDVVETWYFLGHWDPASRTFEKLQEKAGLIDLGYGVFTGPSGFVTPDGRSVLFTIAQGKRDPEEEFAAGWAHNGGLPLELFFGNGGLRIRPVRELDRLNRKKLLSLRNVSAKEAQESLEKLSGNRFRIRLQAAGDYAGIETIAGNEKRTVFYDRQNRRLGWKDEADVLRSRSGGPGEETDLGGEPIRMEYFLDHSMIEVYLNERRSLTLRNYSSVPERKLGIAKGTGFVESLEVWELDGDDL